MRGYLYIPWQESLLLPRPLFQVGEIKLDQINLLLVLRGCAWTTGQGLYASLLLQAQEEARRERRGVWR
ncbi:thermonuclease family protein [Thermus caldilimi]|uniref:thermonuclease family protein n=1 Tax=Thermus caldilimi TaxID=2483360 RepID=UPI0010766C8B|nr:thermonuclease family protein [Thermus caldilimi]